MYTLVAYILSYSSWSRKNLKNFPYLRKTNHCAGEVFGVGNAPIAPLNLSGTPRAWYVPNPT